MERFARGQRIGRYLVLDVLGSGGMGVVYAAYDPELMRKIALKVLRDEGDGEARARLIREARAAARMQHPNVVRVHDVGALGDEVYVAMELVAGESLREWMRRRRGWREAVALLAQAGRGLAASHAAGLVHRDFKPANVLIGRDGRPQVTDFGLARVGARPLGDTPIDSEMSLTVTGDTVGTPAYMAPEQIRGGEVDARADQFSFAITLHEAVYGKRPFTGVDVSGVMASIAAGRILPPPPGHVVPGWVRRAVLRGLAHDPAQRFPSMDGFVDALARGASRRRSVALIALGAAIVVGLAGVRHYRAQGEPMCRGAERHLAGVWDDAAREAVRAGFRRSPRSFAEPTRVAVEHALDDYAADWVAAHTDACAATRLRAEQSQAVLAQRMACLDGRRRDLASVAALLRDPAPLSDGGFAAATQLPPIAWCADPTTLAAQPPPDPRLAGLEGRVALARLHDLAGHPRLGLAIGAAAAAEARVVGNAGVSAAALSTLGSIFDNLGMPRAAHDAYLDAAVAAEASGDDRRAHEVWIGLSRVEADGLGRFPDGLTDTQLAGAFAERLGAPPLLVADVARQRAAVLVEMGRHADAFAEAERALALRRQALPEGHPEVGLALASLARVEAARGHVAEARDLFDRAVAILTPTVGAAHPAVLRVLVARVNVMGRAGDWLPAEAAYRALLPLISASVGEEALFAHALSGLSHALRGQGRTVEALAVMRRALDIFARTLGDDHVSTAEARLNLGAALLSAGEYAEAREVLERAAAGVEAARGEHPNLTAVLGNLAIAQQELGRFDEAEASLARALTIVETTGPVMRHGALLAQRGEVRLFRGDAAAAVVDYRRALAIEEEALGKDSGELAATLYGLGRALVATGAPEEALEVHRRMLRIDEALLGTGHPTVREDREEVARTMRHIARRKARP